MTGRLLVVGTPIGNLDDMSPRATKAIAAADVIFCEDTRRVRKLLSAVGVPAPRLVRLDQHNEAELAGQVVTAVESGLVAVVVSDAGMPTISDPGHRVVEAVAAAGLAVQVVPGPTAVSAALALSGLPASRYRFFGFLARRGRERADDLAAVSQSTDTAVIYESPHRVLRTLTDLAAACGPDRPVAAARELTKLHEEVWRGTLGGAVERLGDAPESPRGEWVLVVGGFRARPAPGSGPEESDVAAALISRLAAGADRKAAVAEVAVELKVPKRTVYDVAVRLQAR